ncbi:MAG TPA: hypothetical protein VMF06_02245, partial [Candidatus Limnocylindria bacterium]|nr:hypothetical protein [Candidatus Limnocylindria bacterium]
NTDYGTTTASYNGTTVADVGGGNVWITCEGVPSMSDGEVLHNVTAFGKTKNYPTGEMTYADSHITGTSGSAKGVAKYQ